MGIATVFDGPVAIQLGQKVGKMTVHAQTPTGENGKGTCFSRKSGGCFSIVADKQKKNDFHHFMALLMGWMPPDRIVR
ncbi:hypothetical protein [Paludibacterium denitrificans]|uniref:Uncharacterized protein n=1 Tax=Paludibacterium denitrificans TaxID=2675226 RepID=A0A844GEN8_9NEIS|nr:hypothetical protein [Paludibacterium denitrificans]MTD34222.1 hypothetical protein [Paludibacterium denitrificans]